MKYPGCAFWLLFLFHATKSSSAESDLEESQAEGINKQQGSWSQWWSYDGISGPDYWNINKQWRLCSLGRKQSPIDVRTDRLVYDHLLGPLQLSWLPAGVTNYDDATLRKASTRKGRDRDKQAKQPVRLRLRNSGRGIEAWLEPGVGAGGNSRAHHKQHHDHPDGATNSLGQQEHLILWRGPLSYAYKLFKIELHSGAAAATSGATGSGSPDLRQQLLGGSAQRTSEHLIDGRAFDGELQLHFYNKHLASSALEAQQLASSEDSRPSLFASIGVFLVLERQHQRQESPAAGESGSDQPTGSSSATTKSAIDFILDNLGALQNDGDSVELQLTRAHIEALIPNRHQYVTYQGSLNRPPCAESVDWILLNKALRVDPAKFEALFERPNTNQDNTRPVMGLHRRLLRTTISNSDAGSGRNVAEEELEEDEGEENLDSNPNISSGSDNNQVEPRTRSRGIHKCGPDAASNNKNCTGQEPDGRSEGARRRGFGSCSMRPNYAYQLRYAKQ